MLHQSALSTQVGSIVTFGDESGFHFELHILSNSSNSITTELQVIAVRQLNGVAVECTGANGTFMSTIRVASVGELIVNSIPDLATHVNLKTLQLLQVES